jgi:hypothetical protein
LFHTSYLHWCFKIPLAYTQPVLLRIPHSIITIALLFFLPAINYIILVQFYIFYKEPSIISGPDAVICSKINFGPMGHHNPQSCPLPHIYTIPSAGETIILDAHCHSLKKTLTSKNTYIDNFHRNVICQIMEEFYINLKTVPCIVWYQPQSWRKQIFLGRKCLGIIYRYGISKLLPSKKYM